MKLPLEGIRVVDATTIWAGPQCSRLLADMGAQTIRIEAGVRPDGVRLMPAADNIVGWNRGGFYNDLNRNKLNLTLDLTKPKGVETFKRLVRVSDVVVENFTRRVMPQLGVDYPVLKEVKPDIIMVSITGLGHYGPYGNYITNGMTMDVMSGLASLTGYPGEEPLFSGIPYADPTSALIGTIAVLMALEYRARTGKGQHIDLPGRDGISCMIGEAIMDYTMNQRVQTAVGNRHPWMAPHGVFRCQGEDNWLAIAVSSDEEWRSLCQVMGNLAWTQEERFANPWSRWHHQEELNRLIEAWTVQYDHIELMHTLLRAGVPAGAVLNHKELLLDAQLKARNFWEVVEFPDIGRRPYPGMSFKLSRTPASIRRHAPTLGEDNAFVLGEILGISEAEIEELHSEGVTAVLPLETVLETRGRAAVFEVEKFLERGYIGYDPDYLEQLGLNGPAD